jgi:hypothetical protein
MRNLQEAHSAYSDLQSVYEGYSSGDQVRKSNLPGAGGEVDSSPAPKVRFSIRRENERLGDVKDRFDQRPNGGETVGNSQEEQLLANMFEGVAGQDNQSHGTMEERCSEKDGVTNGREETEQAAEGSVRKMDRGRKNGGGQNSAGTGGEWIFSSVRMLNRGKRPVHTWAERGLIVPERGSVAESEARVVRGEYQLPIFVVKRDIFNQNHKKSPAFSANGQVFLREDLPENGRGEISGGTTACIHTVHGGHLAGDRLSAPGENQKVIWDEIMVMENPHKAYLAIEKKIWDENLSFQEMLDRIEEYLEKHGIELEEMTHDPNGENVVQKEIEEGRRPWIK